MSKKDEAVKIDIESADETQIVYKGSGGTVAQTFNDPNITVQDNTIIFTHLQINGTHTTLGNGAFTKPGYVLIGWTLTEGGTTVDFSCDASVMADNLNQPGNPNTNTLYAVWEEAPVIIYYTVSAESPEGSGSITIPTTGNETINAVTGEPAGATAAPADGFRFDGWYLDGVKVSPDATFVPEKNDGEVWTERTYYALFSYDVTTLTITNNSGHDAIFTVTGKGYDSGLVLAIPAGKSLTIANVYVGKTYTVSEDGGWSWRYTPFSGSTEPLVAGGNTFSAVLNALSNSKWLSGTSWAWIYDPTLYGVSN